MTLQNHINRSIATFEALNPGHVRKEPRDTETFSSMIEEETAAETTPHNRPRIRIIPPPGGRPPYSPNFEFVWTNRVVYGPGIVPIQSPGCDCEGNCGDPANIGSCFCRKRQENACRTRLHGEKRSGHKGFAYDAEGVADSIILDRQEAIWCVAFFHANDEGVTDADHSSIGNATLSVVVAQSVSTG